MNPARKVDIQGKVTWSLTVNACNETMSPEYETSPPYHRQVSAFLDGKPAWVEEQCVDTTEADYYYDCRGALTRIEDRGVIRTDCQRCSQTGPWLYEVGPYEVWSPDCPDVYLQCMDHYHEYAFTCSDGYSSEEDVFLDTSCTCSGIIYEQVTPTEKEVK
jgi:hypothetical protein